MTDQGKTTAPPVSEPARDEARAAVPEAPSAAPPTAGTAASPPSGRDARAERLAAQLKANLRRRKEQARGRAVCGENDG